MSKSVTVKFSKPSYEALRLRARKANRKLAEYIRESVLNGEVVKLCEQELQWKKSTTYTVLKKLCEHGIFQNENGTVTSLLSQEGYNAVQSEKFVEDTFDGSLPAFLAAFTTRKSLSEKDIAEIQRMIDRCGKE